MEARWNHAWDLEQTSNMYILPINNNKTSQQKRKNEQTVDQTNLEEIKQPKPQYKICPKLFTTMLHEIFMIVNKEA